MDYFPCSKCGECCRHIDKIPELSAYDIGNGICRFLDGDICTIYSDRPDICNVEKMYKIKYKKIMSKDDYYWLNIKGCEILKSDRTL